MPTLREATVELGVMLAIGLTLAALGPFGSFVMGSFAVRLSYWVPIALFGYAIVRPMVGVSQIVARRLDFNPVVAALAGVAIAAAPVSFVVLWWNGLTLAAIPTFERWFGLYLNVALVGLLVTTLFMLLDRRSEARPAMRASSAPDVVDDAFVSVDNRPVFDVGTRPEPKRAGRRFLDRLPPAWADSLLALEMEDHYVRAHGSDASTLILLRMRDAEAELDEVDGLRIHRSWWVARAALDRPVRDGRGFRLRLSNGLEPPVARDRVAALKAAGWL